MNTPEKRKISRIKILDGAYQILNDGVYGDLTVDALAKFLRMSKSTLYKHFGSKEDVVIGLVEHLCNVTDREIELHDLRAGPAREALARLMEVQARHAERMPRAVVLQHGRLPEQSQDRLEITRARVVAGFREILTRGIADRAFDAVDATLASTALLASAEAATISAARGEVDRSRAEAVRSVLAMLLPGITRRATAAA